MFEGSATQFLCILESLSDSNRRILITSPPAPDSDVEILDVYAELFMAAQEILAGSKSVASAMETYFLWGYKTMFFLPPKQPQKI